MITGVGIAIPQFPRVVPLRAMLAFARAMSGVSTPTAHVEAVVDTSFLQKRFSCSLRSGKP
jgi:hypothetical protein